MSATLVLSLTLAFCTGGLWLIRFVAVGRIARLRQALSSHSYPGPPQPAPSVSVVLAAKDEQANIEICVRSLLAQDYPNLELIVVNDRSTDRTGAILDRLAGQADGRLRVVTVTELRDGWFGKNNAMREGVAVSSGSWLLFTDADCRFTSPNAVSMAVREAIATDAEFLSITPVLEAPTIWERVMQPVCALELILWFLPERVNNPAKRTAYANGQFMLISRGCYEGIGGHERVRCELNEDIQMARIAKKSGRRLRVVENHDLFRTRMYPSFPAAWRGWRRIFVGCLQTPRRLGITVGFSVLFTLIPWAALAAAAVGFAMAPPAAAWIWSLMAWALVVLLLQVTIWRIYALLRAQPVWSLAYSLGAMLTLGIVMDALVTVCQGGAIVWRGTTYRGRQVQRGQVPQTTAADEPETLLPEPAAAVTSQ